MADDPARSGRGDPGRGIPTGRLRRAVPLAGLLTRTVGEGALHALRRGDPEGASRLHARTANRYAELLGHSRGVLMKAGQLLSFISFGAVVPADIRAIYQSALARLQADAPPMVAGEVDEVISTDLGRPPDELFAEFEPAPLAAASIGQVHAARLPDGRRVAVKVQYPGVHQAIRDDLRNTELLATFLQLFRALVPGLSSLDMRSISAEVAERIGEEVDYRVEAANQQDFADAFRSHPFIRVPEIIPERSAARVLTMELVDGLQWPQAVAARQELKDRWGEVLWRFVFGSLHRHQLFNADPHPGNYLFHEDGSVSFIDFGCVKRFSPAQQAVFYGLVPAVLDGDAVELWRRFVELGLLDPQDAPAPEELLDWYSLGFRSLTAPQPFAFSPEYAAEVISREFTPGGAWQHVTSRVRMPPDYVFLTRIDLGLLSVLGELRSCAPWARIDDEMRGNAPPATPLGRLEADYLAARAGGSP